MPEPASLHIQSQESDTVRVVDLHGGSIRIGRAVFCDVRIADPDLADEECRLLRRGGAWQLVPARGRTSVTWGSKPLTQPCALRFGESFDVGPLRLTLHKAGALPLWETPSVVPPHHAPAPSSEVIERSTVTAPGEDAVASRSDLTGRLRDEWRSREDRPSRRPPDLAERHKWESKLRAVGARLRADAVNTSSPPRPSDHRPSLRPGSSPIPATPVPRTPVPAATPNLQPSPALRSFERRAVERTAAPVEPPSLNRLRDATEPVALRRARVRTTVAPPTARIEPTPPPARESHEAALPQSAEPAVALPVDSHLGEPIPSETVQSELAAIAPFVAEPIPSPGELVQADDSVLPASEEPAVASDVVASDCEPIALSREPAQEPPVVVSPASSGSSALITVFDEIDEDDFSNAATEPVRTLILGAIRRREASSPVLRAEEEDDRAPALSEDVPPALPVQAAEPAQPAARTEAPSWLLSSWMAAITRHRSTVAVEPERGALVESATPSDSVYPQTDEGDEDRVVAAETAPAPVAADEPQPQVAAGSTPEPEAQPEVVTEFVPSADPGYARPSKVQARSRPIDSDHGPDTRQWFGPDPAVGHAPSATAAQAWAPVGVASERSERGTSVRDWPSVSDILAAQGGRRRSEDRDATQTAPRPRKNLPPGAPTVRVGSEMPTIAVAPAQWSLPLWLAWLPAATLAAGVGTLGCVGSVIWARDGYSAGVVAARLEPAKGKDKTKPLPEGVIPGRPNWWATTGTHLVEWAVYLDRNAADPAQAAEARTLLDRAVEATPLQPSARFALAHAIPNEKDTPPLVRSLGQTRDVAALTWTGRRLLSEGRKAAALRAYAAALEMAAHADPSRMGTPPVLDDAQTKRYSLPGEELIATVIRDLTDAEGLRYSEWSSIVPERTCARVATARVLRDQ
ncbi:MAG: hypothetical protein U0794_17925 [Isosphaeraceae bacterium]